MKRTRKRRTTAEYLAFISEIRNDKGLFYDYSKVNYVSAGIKITIICPIHGEFQQSPSDHRSGSGCRECAKVNRAKVCLEKYGTVNPASSAVIKEKIKTKFVEMYGVDNPSKSDAIKKKKKETCLKNYGVEHPGHSKEIQKRRRDTCIQKYGFPYATQNKEISKKGIATKVANGSFSKSNSSVEATTFIRNYIVEKGYNINQCAYADPEIGLFEWGTYHKGRWVLYDLVVFVEGFRGDKDKVIEILEYHGPFHYTLKDVIERGDHKAYPWKSNDTTVLESYNRDLEKEELGKTMTENYNIIWSKNL